MNNSIIFLTMFGIFCTLTGLFATRLHTLIVAIFEQRRRRKEFPYIESVHEDLLCKGPHKWDKTELAFKGLPVDVYNVCTECGFISGAGSSFKLNGPAIEVFRGHIKRRNERVAKLEAILKNKQLTINEIMNRMIKTHVTDLSTDLHKNIEVLQQFFRKSTMEIESMYLNINEELKKESSG